MIKTIYVKEATDIIKKLSLENQIYMLTLARVAMTAENAIKENLIATGTNEKANLAGRR